MKVIKIVFSVLSLIGLLFYLPSYAGYYGRSLCNTSDFVCMKVKRGQTWAGVFPNRYQREVVMRLNRSNMALSNRSWIVVPRNLSSVNYMSLSPFPHQIEATGRKHVKIKLSQQAFGAYDANGRLVYWGPASGGKSYCPDVGRSCRTTTGSYSFHRKQGAECESSKFPLETNGGAKMPYCMHFYRGFAVHGSNLPGYHASHGCVRVFVQDAKWLNESFVNIGTPVQVSY